MKIENTFLIVLDMQTRLLPVMNNNEFIKENTKTLIKAANELKIPIIYTEQYPNGLGETVEDIKEILNGDNVLYFDKREFSAVPVMKEKLKKLADEKKFSVIITGIETHVCVFQTVRDLIMYGFEVYIPFDAVSSRSYDNYKNALNLLREIGATVTNVETILFDLIKTSEHGSFKFISKLVK